MVVEKPNFGLSGALAHDMQHGAMYRGVQLKWSEPKDAALPKSRWRLYVFKNGEAFGKPLHLHRQTAFLCGRLATVRTRHLAAACPLQKSLTSPYLSPPDALLCFRLRTWF